MSKSNSVAIGAMIDELAAVRDSIRIAQAREKTLRDAIAACGLGEHLSDNFVANVIETESRRIDQDAVRAHVSPQWLAKHTTVSTVISVRVKPRAGSLHAAVELSAA